MVPGIFKENVWHQRPESLIITDTAGYTPRSASPRERQCASVELARGPDNNGNNKSSVFSLLGGETDNNRYSLLDRNASTASMSFFTLDQQSTFDDDDDLVLPESDDILKQVSAGGSHLTFLVVALGIIARHEKERHNFKCRDEFRFLRDCLVAGPEKTQMPCAFVQESKAKSAIGSVRRASVCDPKDLVPAQKSKRTSNREKSRRVTAAPSEEGSAHSARKDKSVAIPAACSPADVESQKRGAPSLGPPVPYWPISIIDLQDKHRRELSTLFDTDFNTWKFDVFDLKRLTGGRPLLFAGWHALSHSGCFSQFHIEPRKVVSFLEQAEPLYKTEALTPYHNNIHAADVVQTAHCLLVEARVAEFFNARDKFVTIFSAIIHDVGHDGRNNAFHISMRDSLALTYNDRSVLENYHLTVAFNLILGSDATNIFSSLASQQINSIRADTIEMVLATDMTVHFSKLGSFVELTSRLGTDPAEWLGDERAMSAFRSTLLHTVDISNPAKSFTLAQQWTRRILNECFAQGDEEKRLGLPVSPLCDRSATDIPESQLGFIKFIVQPTLEAVSVVVPCFKDVALQELARSKKQWEETGRYWKLSQ